MTDIEYVFGTGDGVVSTWTSPADLDLASTGTADALQLDFDGDGLADDALWDSRGTGVADVAALDLDDDGLLDAFFLDPTGLGTWNQQITGTADPAADQLLRSYTEPPAPQADPVTEALADYPLDVTALPVEAIPPAYLPRTDPIAMYPPTQPWPELRDPLATADQAEPTSDRHPSS
ncbi:hypothetical protein IU433_12610 [Nocardia puris]|uniref:Uncharacterized protein n=1 Tax=Nocardia puris TaxID=208602 RepID=A0A366DNH6_9NOCA|nr:hypothetical protein [Nocardia puris]MBF6213658.1 hypothetical protein [Nocardia puris]MBF6365412.1 hypothetical protein [Nocardia puris]MBF6459878.1 hypothetical protein [Nocardia puris]RBO91641.1 hypothetical protein DFR74_104345 [Nocardia puris]